MLAALIFVFTYVAFSVGRVPGFRSDRVAAAIIGAVLLVALGVLSFTDAQSAVDGGTLGLLFGMMVLSAALDVSGAFALVGWWVTRRARTRSGSSPPFIASAVLSAFLINDVVCVAFTPLVLRMAEDAGPQTPGRTCSPSRPPRTSAASPPSRATRRTSSSRRSRTSRTGGS